MRKKNNKPTLTIIIGLPGSGKDTVVKKMIKSDTVVLSSDVIRIELFGFENQENNGRVFDTMRKRCKIALQSGKNVIYNATNLSRKKRTNLIKEMSKYADVDAVICLCSIECLLIRNLTRTERKLPYEKLIQMISSIDIPFLYEGYRNIYGICTDDLFTITQFYKYLEYLDKKTIGYNQGNPHHNETLKEHQMSTYKQILLNTKNDDELEDASSIHDIGKLYTREYNDAKGYYTYYGHHKVSAYVYLVYFFLGKEGIIKIGDYESNVSTLIYHHMDKYLANLETTKELIGEELYKKLEILMDADKWRNDSFGKEEKD